MVQDLKCLAAALLQLLVQHLNDLRAALLLRHQLLLQDGDDLLVACGTGERLMCAH